MSKVSELKARVFRLEMKVANMHGEILRLSGKIRSVQKAVGAFEIKRPLEPPIIIKEGAERWE